MAKNVIINGVQYPNVPEVQIPLADGQGNATFYDTSDADAVSTNVLDGKYYFDGTGKKIGTMNDYGVLNADIESPGQAVTINNGHYTSGIVRIKTTEAAKFRPANIKSGVTILGVSGSSTVVDTTISADAADAATVLTGKKAYVNGQLVTGQMTVPTVSQDSTTKVLTIS